jgi:hypothetical protein
MSWKEIKSHVSAIIIALAEKKKRLKLKKKLRR